MASGFSVTASFFSIFGRPFPFCFLQSKNKQTKDTKKKRHAARAPMKGDFLYWWNEARKIGRPRPARPPSISWSAVMDRSANSSSPVILLSTAAGEQQRARWKEKWRLLHRSITLWLTIHPPRRLGQRMADAKTTTTSKKKNKRRNHTESTPEAPSPETR